MSLVSAPLSARQVVKVRQFLKKVNQLIPYSKSKPVLWTDEQLASRVMVYQRIMDMGAGCPNKAALEYSRLLIGLQSEEILQTVITTKSVH